MRKLVNSISFGMLVNVTYVLSAARKKIVFKRNQCNMITWLVNLMELSRFYYHFYVTKLLLYMECAWEFVLTLHAGYPA